MELTELFKIYKNYTDEDLLEVFSKDIAILIKGFNSGDLDASLFLGNDAIDLNGILQDFNIVHECDDSTIEDLLEGLIRERVEYNIKMDPGAYAEYLNVSDIVEGELEAASLGDYYNYDTVVFDKSIYYIITL